MLSRSQQVDAVLFDMNSRMLSIAHKKLSQHKMSANYVEGDLEDSKSYPTEKPNLIFCFHCPIGFARDTERVLKNLYSHLQEDGLALITAPNKYHGFNFVRQTSNDFTELIRIASQGMVKFKKDMPEIYCYTPMEFQELLKQAGFESVTILGYPVTMYPEKGDTQHLKKSSIHQELKDPIHREATLNLEKRLCLDPKNAYKGGSNLFAVCKKRAVPN